MCLGTIRLKVPEQRSPAQDRFYFVVLTRPVKARLQQPTMSEGRQHDSTVRTGGKGNQGQQHDFGNGQLSGHQYVFGQPYQVELYLKTTNAICDYVGQFQSEEMWKLVHDREETVFKEPVDPGKEATPAQLERYKTLLKEHLDDSKRYRKEKAQLFWLIIGHCSKVMRNKIESMESFSKMQKEKDVIGLLNTIKQLVYSTATEDWEYWTMQVQLRSLLDLKQEPKESLDAFSKRFLDQLAMTEEWWGSLIPAKLKGKPKDDQEQGRQRFLACLFLAAADRERYSPVINDLSNDFHLGTNHYPTDIPGMVALLTSRRGKGTSTKKQDAMRDGIKMYSFAQGNQKKPKCYRCGMTGHVARHCPKRKQKNEDHGSDSEGSTGTKSGKQLRRKQQYAVLKQNGSSDVGWNM